MIRKNIALHILAEHYCGKKEVIKHTEDPHFERMIIILTTFIALIHVELLCFFSKSRRLNCKKIFVVLNNNIGVIIHRTASKEHSSSLLFKRIRLSVFVSNFYTNNIQCNIILQPINFINAKW